MRRSNSTVFVSRGMIGQWLLALLLLACLPLRAAENGCEIVIGSCHKAPLSAAGNGIIDQLVLEAFKRIGKRACVAALPCERSLMNADSGVIDGDILRIPEAIAGRYPQLVAMPELLYALPMSCFTQGQNIQARSFDDLAPLRVGYILGWKILEDRVRAQEVLRVRGPQELFAVLAEGRADTVIYERLAGLRLIEEMSLNNRDLHNIRVIDPPLMQIAQYLVLHQRHSSLLEPLAAALRAMKADGSYDLAFRTAGVTGPTKK